jgi:hypothetical protein
MKKRLTGVLLLAMMAGAGCSKKLQNDSPKRESSGDASASEGYKDENKNTPAAPAKSPEQGTATNGGTSNGGKPPDTTSSTPATNQPGTGQNNGHSNETVPPKGKH